MKLTAMLLLVFIMTSCRSKDGTAKYLKISEAAKVEPKYNEKYGVMSQDIVVILDCENDEVIYFDVWNEKVLTRVSIK